MADYMAPPIPIQDELIPIDGASLLQEFRATVLNETAHMPEVSLRYLLWLVLSDQPLDEVKRFANQVRLDLNEQRLANTVHLAVSSVGMEEKSGLASCW